jgi:altronate hydrolase
MKPIEAPPTAVAIRLHVSDNVVVAAGRVPRGTRLLPENVVALEDIPAGHKVATRPLAAGELVLKYGQVIGCATGAIAAGAHVHLHNLAISADRRAASSPPAAPIDVLPRTFMGFARPGGRVGVRNYIGIVTSVNCSATVARHIATAVERSGLLDAYPNVDGVVPITHTSGCAMASSGEGFDMLRRTLWGTAANPNFGAILMVGLGCEVLQVSRFVADFGLDEREGFRSFTIQDAGGTRRSIEAGLAQVKELLPACNAAQRSAVPASGLAIGLQCGGSDAWSGVTANPALGNAADRLVALGGTVILSETPEIFGAEHLLYARARTPQVADRLRQRIAWWERYTALHGAQMNTNPGPGNHAGGLSTILEKSLGAVAKGGTSPLVDVIEYAQAVTERGLVFMDSPGFDPCSATGQVASGANLVAFTTGRGSAFGCRPSPSIKLASNTAMYEKMRDDMDLDCGAIAVGAATVAEKGAEILDLMLAVASGQRTRSEELGYGAAEFVPWLIGATM